MRNFLVKLILQRKQVLSVFQEMTKKNVFFTKDLYALNILSLGAKQHTQSAHKAKENTLCFVMKVQLQYTWRALLSNKA